MKPPGLLPALVELLANRPIMVALAGPNGAGKSTFYHSHLNELGLRFVNADVFAKELNLSAYTAAAFADTTRRRLVEQRESFIFETVFSDPDGDKLRFLAETQNAGYTVVLCFIGVSEASLSDDRVALRTTQGGHDVPTKKLIERYPRVLKNLATALETLPHVWVFDNSDLENPYRFVARIVGGERIALLDPLPEWLRKPWAVGFTTE